MWNFLRVQEVPVNELHAQGYVSIGCEPCTRPVLPNQLEREGRWWWEDAAREWRGGGVGGKDAACWHVNGWALVVEGRPPTAGDACSVQSTPCNPIYP